MYLYIYIHTVMYLYTDVFYRCKHIGIPTCTQHMLAQSVRRPEDDRLKRRNM